MLLFCTENVSCYKLQHLKIAVQNNFITFDRALKTATTLVLNETQFVTTVSPTFI